jgi:hypothetical protein
MATRKAESNVIELRKLQLERHQIPLWGVSPLIVHAWSHKAKEQMLDKQMKRASAGKQAKDPEVDFEQSLYPQCKDFNGFPSIAFKSAAVDAAIAMEFKKTNLRQSFHIEGELVPILGEPTPREDMVRVGMGIADIRYRGQFEHWGTILPVTINSRMLSIEQLVNLFDAAGFGIGVGEWRPQRDGQFGRFRIATDVEREELLNMLQQNKKDSAIG